MEIWCSLCKSNSKTAIHFLLGTLRTERGVEKQRDKNSEEKLNPGQLWANIFTESEQSFVKASHWAVFILAECSVTLLTDAALTSSDIKKIDIITLHQP